MTDAVSHSVAHLLAKQHRLYPKEGQSSRSWLQIPSPRKWRQQNCAGLSLPPSVHNRASAATNDFVVPVPRFCVDWLAHSPQDFQTGQVKLGDKLVPSSLQSSDQGGSCVEGTHLSPVSVIGVCICLDCMHIVSRHMCLVRPATRAQWGKVSTWHSIAPNMNVTYNSTLHCSMMKQSTAQQLRHQQATSHHSTAQQVEGPAQATAALMLCRVWL